MSVQDVNGINANAELNECLPIEPQSASSGFNIHATDTYNKSDGLGNALLDDLDDDYDMADDTWLSGGESISPDWRGSNSPNDATQRLQELTAELSLQLKGIADALNSEASSYSRNNAYEGKKNQLARVLDNCSELSAIAKDIAANNVATKGAIANTDDLDNAFVQYSNFSVDGGPTPLSLQDQQTNYLADPAIRTLSPEDGEKSAQKAQNHQVRELPTTPDSPQGCIDRSSCGGELDTILALLLTLSYLLILRNLERILARMCKVLLDADDIAMAALALPGCQLITRGLCFRPNMLLAKITLEIITHTLGCIETQLGLPLLFCTKESKDVETSRSGLLADPTTAMIVKSILHREGMQLLKNPYQDMCNSTSQLDSVHSSEQQISHPVKLRILEIQSIISKG